MAIAEHPVQSKFQQLREFLEELTINSTALVAWNRSDKKRFGVSRWIFP
jgi:hypothetical protein